MGGGRGGWGGVGIRCKGQGGRGELPARPAGAAGSTLQRMGAGAARATACTERAAARKLAPARGAGGPALVRVDGVGGARSGWAAIRRERHLREEQVDGVGHKDLDEVLVPIEPAERAVAEGLDQAVVLFLARSQVGEVDRGPKVP